MAKGKSTILPRICIRCGKVFPGGPRAWYCPACREDRRQEARARYLARRRMRLHRPLGSKDACEVCGGEYVVRCANQRYCPDCAPEAVRRVDHAQGRAWYEKNKPKYNAARNLARQMETFASPATGICCMCGREFVKRGIAKSCPDCRAEFRRQSQARWDRERQPPKGTKAPDWTDAEVSEAHALRAEGKTYAETGELLGRSVTAVRKKLRNAAPR
jgi:hypothetical protein